jgi:hypothetical protein
VSSLCEPESHLLTAKGSGPGDGAGIESRLFSNISSPMSSSSSGDFHQRQPLLQESKSNGGWDDDSPLEESLAKSKVRECLKVLKCDCDLNECSWIGFRVAI